MRRGGRAGALARAQGRPPASLRLTLRALPLAAPSCFLHAPVGPWYRRLRPRASRRPPYPSRHRHRWHGPALPRKVERARLLGARLAALRCLVSRGDHQRNPALAAAPALAPAQAAEAATAAAAAAPAEPPLAPTALATAIFVAAAVATAVTAAAAAAAAPRAAPTAAHDARVAPRAAPALAAARAAR